MENSLEYELRAEGTISYYVIYISTLVEDEECPFSYQVKWIIPYNTNQQPSFQHKRRVSNQFFKPWFVKDENYNIFCNCSK